MKMQPSGEGTEQAGAVGAGLRRVGSEVTLGTPMRRQKQRQIMEKRTKADSSSPLERRTFLGSFSRLDRALELHPTTPPKHRADQAGNNAKQARARTGR